MSINIGNFNNINRYDLIDNNLTINSYTNSNIINLNIDSESYENSLINFKNTYFTGFKNNLYVINNNVNNDLISISYKEINLNLNTKFNNDININNLVYTCNNTVIINSNIIFNLNNKFIIKDENSNELLYISNSNISLNNIININSNINIKSDLYINNSTLYVNNIRSFNINSNINIYNPTLYGLRVINSIYNNYLHIINDKKYNDDISFQIKKYPNKLNIVDIFTCNINYLPQRQLCINENGFISISSNLPIANLYITNNISSNIILYEGFNEGDKFIINDKGNVGIGTTKPINLLQIDRKDDLIDNNVRSNPIIGLNVQYNHTSNYTTSNLLFSKLYVLDNTIEITDILDNIISTTDNVITNININYSSNITIFQQYSSNIQNIFTINNNNDNIVYKNNTYIYSSEIPILVNNTYNFYIFTQLNYPDIFQYELNNDNYNTFNIDNDVAYYNYYYYFNLMTMETYNNGAYKNNKNKFFTISTSNIIVNNNFVEITAIFSLLIEKSVYYYYYIEPNPILQHSPYLLYATSNDNFTCSISSYGGLSLGTLQPNDNYKIYTEGNARIDNIECYNLKSIEGKKNINFSYCNLSNINIIVNNSNISKYLSANIGFIDNLSINTININKQNTNYINSSNINFLNLYSSNVFFNPNSISFYIPLYIINNFININTTSINNVFEITTSNININPTLTLSGYNIYSYPNINIINTKCNYTIGLCSNIFNNNITDSFQIYNKLNNYNIIQHINTYNVLNIGTNNITIDLNIPTNFTNLTNKISFNYPYRYLIQNNFLPSMWSHYFYNNIINVPYKFNSYGSFNFSTINNIPIFRAFINDNQPLNEKIYIGICGEPNNINNVVINGDVLVINNIITSNDCYISSNCYVTKTLYAGAIGSLSDISIKTDFYSIKNSLKKINTLSGYNYKRKDTGKREIGLIAQEVEKIFPEVINRNDNDLLHISYGNMTAILVECIKELTEKINNIEKYLNIPTNMEI